MTTDTSYIEGLRTELSLIYGDGVKFFSKLGEVIDKDYVWFSNSWEQLPTEQKTAALEIRKRLADCGARLIEAVRKSALL